MVTLNYTSHDRVLKTEPMIGSVTTLNSEQIAIFLQDAEAEVNASIVRYYTLPVSSSDLLQTVATDISIYRILSRRVFTQERLKNSGWVDRFKEARDILEDIAIGKRILVDSDGDIIGARTDVAEVKSNTMDYHPTMSDLPDTLDRIDPDKVEDLMDDRDLYVTKDLIK